MRLCPDAITIDLGGEVIELRPTLRAATRIARQFDGFAGGFDAIRSGNVTAMASIMREGAGGHSDMPDLFAEIGLVGLRMTLEEVSEPLALFVLALAGADDQEASTNNPQAEPSSFADYFRQLFQIATGWLGWSPADAWNATPAEIAAAYAGKIEMLKAIYGAADASGTSSTDPTYFADPNAKPDHRSIADLKAELLMART